MMNIALSKGMRTITLLAMIRFFSKRLDFHRVLLLHFAVSWLLMYMRFNDF